MGNNAYRVMATQSISYIDQGGSLVNGYKVFFEITEFRETHSVQVPTLDPPVVQAAIQAVVTHRKALSAL